MSTERESDLCDPWGRLRIVPYGEIPMLTKTRPLHLPLKPTRQLLSFSLLTLETGAGQGCVEGLAAVLVLTSRMPRCGSKLTRRSGSRHQPRRHHRVATGDGVRRESWLPDTSGGVKAAAAERGRQKRQGRQQLRGLPTEGGQKYPRYFLVCKARWCTLAAVECVAGQGGCSEASVHVER